MNNWKSFRNSLVVASAFATSGLLAQSPAASMPYYKAIAPDTEWVIKVTSLKKSQGRAFTEIRGQRSADLRHEIISWGDLTTERWLTGDFLLETAAEQPGVMMTPYAKIASAREKRLAELPELDWLNPARRKGSAEVKGKTCHYYEYTEVVSQEIDAEIRERIKAGKLTGSLDSTSVYKAWIDVQTGLPVAYESPDYRYEYEFALAKEKLRLSLPEKFLQALPQ